MAERTDAGGPGLAEAEAVRRALLEVALRAHDDAGLSGLCAEGRWEAAEVTGRDARLEVEVEV